MNLKQFHIVLIYALFLSCDNDDYPHSEVPSVVLNSFQKQFPGASGIEYNEVGNNFEVEFEVDQKNVGIIIGPSGSVLKAKRALTMQLLPPEVRRFIEEEFPEEEIEDLEIVVAGDQVYYQFQIGRIFTDKKFVIDETGRLDASTDYWD